LHKAGALQLSFDDVGEVLDTSIGVKDRARSRPTST
jgi:hypothetical protein